jgi:hypothetical protein
MMKYIEIGLDTLGNKIFGRVDEDGLVRYTCTEDDDQYQAWLNPMEQSTPSVIDEAEAK